MNEAKAYMEELNVHINNCKIEMIKRTSSMFDQFMQIKEIPEICTLFVMLIIFKTSNDIVTI